MLDLTRLAKTLADHDVRYVLLGGMAVVLRGGVALTQDIDLAIAASPENLSRLAEAINVFNPRVRSGARVTLDAQSFGGAFVRFRTDVGVVDILFSTPPFEHFDELYAESQDVLLESVPVRTATIRALKALKRAAGRERDLEHLEMLEGLPEAP